MLERAYWGEGEVDLVKRGRKPRTDRSAVRTKKVEFVVTEEERELLDRKAKEDGLSSRAQWIREMCGLPGQLEEENDDAE